MTTVTAEAGIDMLRLLVGYQTYNGPNVVSIGGKNALEWSLYYPGDFFPPVKVTLTGTGLSSPTANGTVTGLTIVLDDNDPDAPLMIVSDFSVPLSTFMPGGVAGDLDLPEFFSTYKWSTDSFAVEGDSSKLLGDVEVVNGGTKALASDTFFMSGVDGTIYADTRLITGGSDLGTGWDTITVTADTDSGIRVYGDAQAVDGATVRAGNDQINLTGTDIEPGLSQNFLYGDVESVRGTSDLNGGNDVIRGGYSITDWIYGDASLLDSSTATIDAGDDEIRGRSGNDYLYGDIDNLARGELTGGNDTIYGGSGNDYLFGDYGRQSFGTLTSGGNDLLVGGTGADILVGNEGRDTLRGGSGNDTMLGGSGHDTMWAYTGADVLEGGAGLDSIAGGPGADTFIYRDPSDSRPSSNKETILDFERGVDTLDISKAADFSTTGGLTWTGAYTGAQGTIGFTQYTGHIFIQANLDADSAKEMVIRLNGLTGFDAGDLLL